MNVSGENNNRTPISLLKTWEGLQFQMINSDFRLNHFSMHFFCILCIKISA